MPKRLGSLSSPDGANVFYVHRRSVSGEKVATAQVIASLPDVDIANVTVNAGVATVHGERYPPGTLISFKAQTTIERLNDTCDICVEYTTDNGIAERVDGLFISITDKVDA